MKISLSFQELSKVLGIANIIVGDKSLDQKNKNIIFMVKDEEVRVIGYNLYNFSRTLLNNAVIEGVPDEGWLFQVHSAELGKIIGSFSNLSRTEVTGIDLVAEEIKIKVVVHEEAVEGADSRLSRESSFLLERPDLMSKVIDEINMPFPEDEADMEVSGDILLYLSSMLPLMNNDSVNGVASKLNFHEDHVFVIASAMSAFFKNKLSDAFKGICLSYSGVSFLKKMCEDSDNLMVSKTDRYLCISSTTSGTQSFMKYQNITMKFEKQLNDMVKDKGIKVDRMYLKDVLRRMSSMSQDGRVRVIDDELEVENDRFSQRIPLIESIGDVSDIEFKVSVPILEKTIMGVDSVFGDYAIEMYFVPSRNGYSLYVCDEVDAWVANTRVSSR